MDEFLRRYGTEGLSLLIQRFITDAPPFEGDYALAKEIGTAMGCLMNGLNDYIKERV